MDDGSFLLYNQSLNERSDNDGTLFPLVPQQPGLSIEDPFANALETRAQFLPNVQGVTLPFAQPNHGVLSSGVSIGLGLMAHADFCDWPSLEATGRDGVDG